MYSYLEPGYSPYTRPAGAHSVIGEEPLNESRIQEFLKMRLTQSHHEMLEGQCGISPPVLVQSECFSLKGDENGHQFLLENGFTGAQSLIEDGLVFPGYDLQGNLQAHTIVNTRPRLDRLGRSVFYEQAQEMRPRISVSPAIRNLLGAMDVSLLNVWSTNPIYTLIAASRGLPAYHVVGGDINHRTERDALRQSLHDLEAVWHCCETIDPHLFLHPYSMSTPAMEFDAMRLIAQVLRGRGAEVIEAQLPSHQHPEGEWMANSYNLTPGKQDLQIVKAWIDTLKI